uniref:Kinin prepropeptide n=2 Tax=Rhodnius prolixus TaxID=13249 RepID=F2FB36_RHOPR|nr:TPA_exp: kinin prepropeptide [Rhodnius prolixus]
MILLWMVWTIAVICKTSQGNDIISTSAEGHNLTTAPSPLPTAKDNSKGIRDKRGTGHLLEQLLKENELAAEDLEDEEDLVNDKIKRTNNRGNFAGNPRMRFSSWAGKRAKFSSWGGKRVDDELISGTDGPIEYEIPEDKRANKFSSWAGKRTDEEGVNWMGNSPADLDSFIQQLEQKRAKFSSWAGKRDEDRQKFSHWAGKKFDDSLNMNDVLLEEEKRGAKFSSWAGKRAKFNSWGGKRFSNEFMNDNNDIEKNIVEEKRLSINPWKKIDDNGKRAKFSSWGGKRADDDWLKKARFNSWGGKRNSFNANITNSVDDLFLDHEDALIKRSAAAYTPLSWKRKPIFSSWGGKRTARSTQPQRRLIFPSNLFRDHSTWGALLRPIRRGPDFYAWGGKRST